MLERDYFPENARNLLKLLLAQDGSTTKLCEAITDAQVLLTVHTQTQVETVPEIVQVELGGANLLKRVTSLHTEASVLMDNLTFTNLDRVPDWFLNELEQGLSPIGHLLSTLFVQRRRIKSTPELEAQLFEIVGFADSSASRTYTISTEHGALMLVFETYRDGLARAFEAKL